MLVLGIKFQLLFISVIRRHSDRLYLEYHGVKTKKSSINTKDGASMVASVDKANPAGKQAAASGLGDQQQSAAYRREIVFKHKRRREGSGQ